MRPLTLVCLSAIWASASPASADDSPVRVRHRTPPANPQYCGIDCLYLALRVAGDNAITLRQLESELPLGPNGVSLDALAQAARGRGVATTVVRTDLAHLTKWGKPAILHVHGSHYITLLGVEEDRVILFDNGAGLIDSPADILTEHYHWDGVALVLSPPSPEVELRRYGPGAALLALGLVGGLIAARRLLRQQPVPPPTASVEGPPDEPQPPHGVHAP